MRKRYVLTVLTWLLLGGIAVSTLAQADDCPALVQQALTDIGTNCGGLARNSACYGFNRVAATFAQDVPEDYFRQPADRAELSAMQTIQTAPLDAALNEWGVALMSVQANVPDTLPGQSVIFVLLGDVAVENAVEPQDSQPVEPVTITAAVVANVRSGPSRRANVIGSVPVGTELAADGLSPDDGWFRVAYSETVGWISREVVTVTDAANALPVITDEPRTPMQAFYLRTGIDQPVCNEAPSLLVVQGPQRLEVNIAVNGADVRLGSTVVFQVTEAEKLKLLVVDGKAQTGGVQIPAGFTAQAELDADGNVQNGFSGLRPMNRQELALLQTLENIPPEVLNYGIEVQDRPSTIATQPPPESTPNVSTTITPTVGGPVDCSKFVLTSPREGLAYGLNNFYWDPAPGATSYRVNVWDFASAETSAPNTNLSMDLTPVGTKYEMTITVDALLNGQVACTTPAVTLLREASPQPFIAAWNCVSGTQFVVNYANVPPGTTGITISFVDAGYSYASFSPNPGVTLSVPPFSGSQLFTASLVGYELANGVVTANPSGITAPITPSELSCGY